MPSYTVKNKKTGEHKDLFCSWDELQQVLGTDSDIEQVLGTPNIVGMTGSVIGKTSNAWQDKLKDMKKKHGKNNTINV